MESDLLKKLEEFPSPFFWNLDKSTFAIVHEKLIRWKCSEADRPAWNNTTAFLSYARENDPVKSRRQFQEVLDQDPGNLVALTSLAYIDVKHSDVTSAEIKRKTLAELKESGGEAQKRWATAMFEKAFCLTQFGQMRHVEALGCVEEALKYDSENKEWLKTETFLLTKRVDRTALAQVRQGEIQTFLDRAAANVLKLREMDPDSGEALCTAAELFEAAGSTEEGKSWKGDYKNRYPYRTVDPSNLYEMAYELSPTDQSVCRKVVIHLKEAREWQKMEEILKKALKDFPNDSLLYYQLGLRYFNPFLDALERERKTWGTEKGKAASAKIMETSTVVPRAKEYFQKGLRLEPRFTRCRINLAKCLYYQGMVQDSWRQFSIAVLDGRDRRERHEARREWARLLIDEGNESAALMQLCDACFQDERQEKACEGSSGNAREGMGSHDMAIDCNRQELEIQGDTAYLAAKAMATSAKNLDRSLDQTVLFNEACSQVGRSICHMVVLHFKYEREWQRMEGILQSALKYFPNTPFLYYQYGLRYLVPYELALAEATEYEGNTNQSHRHKATLLTKAEKYFQKALKIDPLFTRCRVNLARCLYYRDKVQECWQQFRIAVQDARDDSYKVEARREWARLLIQTGDESGALTQLCEALKVNHQGYQSLDYALDNWCKYDHRNPMPIRVRAAFALEAGKAYKAIRCFEQALQIDDNDTSSLLGLEKAYRI